MITKYLTRSAIATAFVFATALPSMAGTFTVTTNNETRHDISRVAVLIGDGEIEGFEEIPAGESGSFKIVLENGACMATLRLRVGVRYVDSSSHNFCSGQNSFTFK